MTHLRLHLLGLPNAPVNLDYSLDGFAAAGFRFAQMMKSLGHYVILYGAEHSNAPCDEFIQIISERERTTLLTKASVGNCEYQHVTMDESRPLWQISNPRAAAEVALRKQPRDLLLTIGGCSQRLVFQFNPELMGVEYSIGYDGPFCSNRVFESYSHMHRIYGRDQLVDGRFFDTVIPMFFDPEQFSTNQNTEDYFLYAGRLTEKKGVHVAVQACSAAGVKLKVIGHGEGREAAAILDMVKKGGHDYLGAIGWKERNDVMARARAVFTPTIYIEPFGCVTVEAQMCGTPVISTDWGGFTETVEQGKTGFRCSYLGEFVRAIRDIGALDRNYIAKRAVEKYSMHVLKHDYQRYFERLLTRWGKGWDTV
jgi:glycosyltransferase involved in cell wall biosynthesis